MYRTQQQKILTHLVTVLETKYGVTLAQIAAEQPPKTELGEVALPVAFELAKRLKKAPRVIAQELADEMRGVEGIASVDIAGAGYLNLKFDRASLVRAMAVGQHADVGGLGFRLVEHTSINPNKAAHVGHLRNAILGDTFQRLLRKDDFKNGYGVGVQNYIDNTGVQVADVVVGLTHLEGKSLADVRSLLIDLKAKGQRIDYYLWDLYARVSRWYTEDPADIGARKELRLATLHLIEEGGNDTAIIADIVATAVIERHLETMQRLDIEYDFLPRESEILHLHFWDAARALMIEKGVLYEETEGKNKGCWVMRRPGTEQTEGTDDDAKVIVRSNGTVTYVGKDIAYHLWKFGLLPGKDFGYAKFHEYPTHTCWISTVHGENPHPTFGKADWIYNVIDSRQNDPQANVMEALRGMGYEDAANRYTHLNYAMVALTPRCAIDLGYEVSEEDRAKPYLEVSGRKGFGVKADDLLDRLIEAAKAEVDKRHPDRDPVERETAATQIAVGALRYFMLKFTRNTVIAFDLRDALSFEGETGPYVQYAIVRAGNILRKAGVEQDASLDVLADVDVAAQIDGDENNSVWEIWLMASRLTTVIEAAIVAAEPALLARYAFQLAQAFNNFYHRHQVLSETDLARKTVLLATAAVARREMIRALRFMGMDAPSFM
ncbi:arginine--tRNA ligase [Terriglobus saanensis]|uniref:arginine--tRNA ligase n=1 Tax=Terriglobus saanensis (strain ATCC BAA-1853 / DSM 23119 / SP1PR4) TaxID=401053 RepID=E8V0T4_TERSS|nr:DALR anticodon-binding domain-containing protein [Terriglobus saanensis]ADV82225.1 Arginine--tRNA ligase [Terriglobus saanensis SP1PR4]